MREGSGGAPAPPGGRRRDDGDNEESTLRGDCLKGVRGEVRAAFRRCRNSRKRKPNRSLQWNMVRICGDNEMDFSSKISIFLRFVTLLTDSDCGKGFGICFLDTC